MQPGIFLLPPRGGERTSSPIKSIFFLCCTTRRVLRKNDSVQRRASLPYPACFADLLYARVLILSDYLGCRVSPLKYAFTHSPRGRGEAATAVHHNPHHHHQHPKINNSVQDDLPILSLHVPRPVFRCVCVRSNLSVCCGHPQSPEKGERDGRKKRRWVVERIVGSLSAQHHSVQFG